jgi:hypothetical protein
MRLPSLKALLILVGIGAALGAGSVGLLIWRFRRLESTDRLAPSSSRRNRSRIEPLP